VGRNYQVIQGTNRLHGVQVLDGLFFLSDSFTDNSSVILSTAPKKSSQRQLTFDDELHFLEGCEGCQDQRHSSSLQFAVVEKYSMSIQSIERER
jgi:hypothetical protein